MGDLRIPVNPRGRFFFPKAFEGFRAAERTPHRFFRDNFFRGKRKEKISRKISALAGKMAFQAAGA
jgi:hypothetical protein